MNMTAVLITGMICITLIVLCVYGGKKGGGK